MSKLVKYVYFTLTKYIKKVLMEKVAIDLQKMKQLGT